MNLYENIKNNLNEDENVQSGMTLYDYIKNVCNGEIDMDVCDNDIDMMVAFCHNINEHSSEYPQMERFLNLLAKRTKIIKQNNGGYAPILICDFSSALKPYNEEWKKFFDMDYSDFDEDEAYYEAVVNLEPLISGNAGEDTYKEFCDIMEGKKLEESEEENEEQICVICNKPFTGWGNDAWPVAEGYCCDECNFSKVIPARLAQLREYRNDTKIKESESFKLNKDAEDFEDLVKRDFQNYIEDTYNIQNVQELADRLEHVTEEDINDYFTTLFYEIFDNEDMETANLAEEIIRKEYGLQDNIDESEKQEKLNEAKNYDDYWNLSEDIPIIPNFDLDNFPKDKLWQLRKEITLGSPYLSKYDNSLGLNPAALRNFFNSFVENGKNNNKTLKDIDNQDDLYNFYINCEDPFNLKDELDESEEANLTLSQIKDNLEAIKNNEERNYEIYGSALEFPSILEKIDNVDDRRKALMMLYMNNPKLEELKTWTAKQIKDYILDTEEVFNINIDSNFDEEPTNYRKAYAKCFELIGTNLNESAKGQWTSGFKKLDGYTEEEAYKLLVKAANIKLNTFAKNNHDNEELQREFEEKYNEPFGIQIGGDTVGNYGYNPKYLEFLNSKGNLDEAEDNQLYVFSNAESEDMTDAISMINSIYKNEAPKLQFKMHSEGPMWFVDFIGSYQDICDYLIKLGWYNEKEINDLTNNKLIRPLPIKESEEKVNPNNLTKEQLWKLRQEIRLNSIYTNDYENSFDLDPVAVQDFFDTFIEDMEQDDDGNPNNRKIEDYDNADDLYNFYTGCENPFGEIEEIKESEDYYDDDDDYWEDHNDDPIECTIEYDEDGKPYFMYNNEKEYIDEYMKDGAGGATKPLTAFSAIRIVHSDNGETVSVQYLHDSEKIKEAEESDEDKKLSFKERVLKAYDNCNYSVRSDMPTIKDIIDYLDLSNDSETRDKVSQIIYKAGKDWQVESCNEAEDKEESKEEVKHKDDIKVYMNTWKNYNEYGADLDAYGIKDGWMNPDDALEFCKKYAEDEPFINDIDNNSGIDIEVSEYDNAPSVLEGLAKLNDVLYFGAGNAEKGDIPLVYEAWADKESATTPSLENIENFIDFLENGEYYVHNDVTSTEDIGKWYVENVGYEGVSNIENYIDSDQVKEDWQEDIDQNYLDDDGNPTEDWYEVDDSLVDEDIESAKQSNDTNFFDKYFDYASLGDDIYGDGNWYVTDNGSVEIY